MNWLAEHEAFANNDDDSLPVGSFSSYQDEEQSADWTLAQAIGWIHGRTAAWARRFAPEYLRLKPSKPLLPLTPDSVIDALKNVAPIEELLSLKAGLYHRLRSGELVAEGKKPGECVAQEIPRRDWRADTVDELDQHCGNHDDLGAIDGKDAYSKVVFNAVRVLRADVLRLWPAPMHAEDPTPHPTDWPALERGVDELTVDRAALPDDQELKRHDDESGDSSPLIALPQWPVEDRDRGVITLPDEASDDAGLASSPESVLPPERDGSDADIVVALRERRASSPRHNDERTEWDYICSLGFHIKFLPFKVLRKAAGLGKEPGRPKNSQN